MITECVNYGGGSLSVLIFQILGEKSARDKNEREMKKGEQQAQYENWCDKAMGMDEMQEKSGSRFAPADGNARYIYLTGSN